MVSDCLQYANDDAVSGMVCYIIDGYYPAVGSKMGNTVETESKLGSLFMQELVDV